MLDNVVCRRSASIVYQQGLKGLYPVGNGFQYNGSRSDGYVSVETQPNA